MNDLVRPEPRVSNHVCQKVYILVSYRNSSVTHLAQAYNPQAQPDFTCYLCTKAHIWN